MAKMSIPHSGPIVTRVDARAAGLARFFTGKPCKHSHLSQRTTANGGCIQCNAITASGLYQANKAERDAKTKAWKDANRDKVRAWGRVYSKGHREEANAWKAANRDAVNAAEREARKRNPEAYKAASDRYLASDQGKAARKAHYDANKDAIVQRVREWTLANPDRALESRQARYEANKDAIKQRVREWNEANPEAARARGRNYRARKNEAEGSHTGVEILELYVKQGGQCVYCRCGLADNYHADHIQPLARGGSNWISNIQLTCGPCNIRKRAIDPVEFARRLALAPT